MGLHSSKHTVRRCCSAVANKKRAWSRAVRVRSALLCRIVPLQPINAMRTIPRDMFDKLKASADANGGVGALKTFDREARPCCLMGHARTVFGNNNEAAFDVLRRAFNNQGVGDANDLAVVAVNKRDGNYIHARIPFDVLATELQLVPSDDPRDAVAA